MPRDPRKAHALVAKRARKAVKQRARRAVEQADYNRRHNARGKRPAPPAPTFNPGQLVNFLKGLR